MDTVGADAPVTPILGLDAATTARVLATAGRAPSLHNAQPWRFRTGADHVELRADPARRLPVADPTDRELRIGCGAALYSLRLALAGAGIRPLVTRLPDPSDPELLAVVRRGAAMPPTPEQRRLLEA
ncbi:nitroreductase, partial [Pseudonocardia sp. SID8383]|nr:nitroreductase [Pseudonocardia sp. SID8383]